MKVIALSLMAAMAVSSAAIAGASAGGCPIDSDSCGGGGSVSDVTRGAFISGNFSGPFQPSDPYRGAVVSVLAKTLPPNPIKDVTTDP